MTDFDFDFFLKEFSLQDKKDKFENETNQIGINTKIKNILFDYQEKHLKNLINIIRNKDIVIDGSDTGTGKTYIAAALANFFNLKPFIICPKAIMSSWKNVLQKFDIIPIAIVNYETIKTGKYYINNSKEKRKECPYLKIIKEDDNKKFIWNLPPTSLLIFDEVHQCRKGNSQNTQLLLAAKNINCKKLLLSATLADSIENFCIFGYMINLYDKISKVNKWINSLESINILSEIHKKIYPFNGSRMKISELGNKFQKNQISVDIYDMDNSCYIQKEYSEIDSAIKQLKNNNKDNKFLINITKARQKIELLKIPTFIDLTKQYLENNFSIVIFVNFKKTLESLSKYLKTNCIIQGNQTISERQTNITNFLENKEKVIICNIKAGGVGINLQDKNGDFPRISLINPTWSSTDLKQCLGRIHRADSKSPSLQRIICCSNTIEEKICDRLNIKMSNIDSINDGDLQPFSIK